MHPEIFTAVMSLGVAGVVMVLLVGLQVHSETVAFLSSIGVNVKVRNRFGQVTAEFFEIDQIKDVVILEAISMQRVICYLAIILEGRDRDREQIFPLFMKSRPDLVTLEIVYRDIHQLFSHRPAS